MTKFYSALFEYIRQIVYLPEQARFQAGNLELGPDEKKVIQGLDLLVKYLHENNKFAKDLAEGTIRKARVPSRGNPLAGTLKATHGALKHLLWLMDEVSQGDYKQRLNLMGDLSISFNKMLDYLLGLSYRDWRTGLLNAEGFDRYAAVCLRENTGAAPDSYFILSVNINDFRHYNSLYGWQKGDELLQKVANFLREKCAPGELCARLYADRFVCLLRGESPGSVSERLNVNSSGKWEGTTSRTYLFRQGVYEITDPSFTVREMRQRAAFACASIKDDPLHASVSFDEKMQKIYQQGQMVLRDFEEALQQHRFVVYYQPKVDLRQDKITECEALVRWQYNESELVPPGSFINMLESNGLITALDCYVARQVCEQLRQGLDKNQPVVPVAVNFSRVHLLDNDFVSHLQEILKEYNISTKWFQVELTETAMYDNKEATLRLMRNLHQAGFSVAIDDFGSGFSSLNFLKNIPFDVLKIDKMFLDDFNNGKTRYLLEDILSIARHFNLKTVAEGVELKEQADFLKQYGCDMIQGFYYYHPMPFTDMLQAVKARNQALYSN